MNYMATTGIQCTYTRIKTLTLEDKAQHNIDATFLFAYDFKLYQTRSLTDKLIADLKYQMNITRRSFYKEDGWTMSQQVINFYIKTHV